MIRLLGYFSPNIYLVLLFMYLYNYMSNLITVIPIMKKILLLFVLTLTFSLSSCYTTSRAVVSDSANLAKYNYAAMTDVIGYTGSAALMDLEVSIYNALSATRLQVIGDGQLALLSDDQKKQLLIVRFSASQSDEESIVSINFVDYMTGKPVASCRGAYGMGWTKDHDMRIAVDRAFEQIKKLF